MSAAAVSRPRQSAFAADTGSRTTRIERRRDILTWQQANQLAHVAAARAHAALSVDLTRSRVDVVAAIGEAEIDLLWRPMPRVFGIYFNEPDANIGILVNSSLHIGARRHTAAHELGHHWLEHTTSVDDGSTIDLGDDDPSEATVDFLPSARSRRWTDQEKTAEAFAVWFLMPRRVVQNALTALELERPRNPVDVYRLATILGTSHATTLRHLPSLRIATVKDTERWAKVAPGRIKVRLDRGTPPPATRRRDVVILDHAVGDLGIHVETGDRVVIPGVNVVDVEAPTWLGAVGVTCDADLGDGVVLEVAHLDEAAVGHLTVDTVEGRWTAQVTAGPQLAGRQEVDRS